MPGQRPPYLYHLFHRAPEGDALMPSQANEQDPAPYVYATENLKECLPFAAPNGTRLVNATIPGTDDVLTVIPDRNGFLRDGKMSGVIYRFSSDGFERHPQNPTQWVSPDPVPFSKMEKVAEINGIDEALRLGLQLLFTHKPFVENFPFIEDVMKDPEFPANLKHYVSTGDLDYENGIRDINPLTYLSSDTPKPAHQPATAKPANRPPSAPRR